MKIENTPSSTSESTKLPSLTEKEGAKRLSLITSQTEQVARAAGERLRQSRMSFDTNRIEKKHPHDYVSYVDRETEEYIVAQLKTILPEAGFITEEGTTSTTLSPYYWVIDPLDGTTNFLRDNAPYCVSIALRSSSELLAGIVYEVCRDELFSTFKGSKSLLNGHEIQVSKIAEPTEAYAILELPYNVEQYKNTGAHLYDSLYGTVASIRALGSAAAELCYVAAGRHDIYFEAFLGRWDFSAGALILRNAGGQVTDFLGHEEILDTHHIVATNALLHPYILQQLSESLPKNL